MTSWQADFGGRATTDAMIEALSGAGGAEDVIDSLREIQVRIGFS